MIAQRGGHDVGRQVRPQGVVGRASEAVLAAGHDLRQALGPDPARDALAARFPGAEPGQDPDQLDENRALLAELLEALPIPTIAAINGFARAGGFELACGCDFIVIGENAKIGDAHTDAGVVPAQVTLRLRRRVGAQRAKEILWTARWLTAREAVDIGLALHAFPDASLLQDTIAFARTMTDKPAAAIASLKRILVEGEDMSLAEGTELELKYFTEYMSTQPHGREGYYAFREKRAPRWRK